MIQTFYDLLDSEFYLYRELKIEELKICMYDNTLSEIVIGIEDNYTVRNKAYLDSV